MAASKELQEAIKGIIGEEEEPESKASPELQSTITDVLAGNVESVFGEEKTLYDKAVDVKSRFLLEFWNKGVAGTVDKLVSDPTQAWGDTTYLAQKKRREQRKAVGPDLPTELLDDEYEDIKRQLALVPAARADDDLQNITYQYAPEKPSMEIEAPPPEGVGEKGAAIAAGVSSFIAKLALLRQVAPLGTHEAIIWEANNLLEGGRPGRGAALYGTLGLAGSIPIGGITGTAVRLGTQGTVFGGLTWLEGGSTEDIIVAAAIPAVLHALRMGPKTSAEMLGKTKIGQRTFAKMVETFPRTADALGAEPHPLAVKAVEKAARVQFGYNRNTATAKEKAHIQNKARIVEREIMKVREAKASAEKPAQASSDLAKIERNMTKTQQSVAPGSRVPEAGLAIPPDVIAEGRIVDMASIAGNIKARDVEVGKEKEQQAKEDKGDRLADKTKLKHKQNQRQLTEEEVREIPEDPSSLGWLDLQAVARAHGIDPFQKKAAILSSLETLRAELPIDLVKAGERDARAKDISDEKFSVAMDKMFPELTPETGQVSEQKIPNEVFDAYQASNKANDAWQATRPQGFGRGQPALRGAATRAENKLDKLIKEKMGIEDEDGILEIHLRLGQQTALQAQGPPQWVQDSSPSTQDKYNIIQEKFRLGDITKAEANERAVNLREVAAKVPEEEVIPRTPEEKDLQRRIKILQKDLGLSDKEYRAFLTEETGLSTTTKMNQDQLTASLEALNFRGSRVFTNKVAKEIGMTQKEHDDVISRIPGDLRVPISQKLFNYYKGTTLSKDPFIRRRQLDDMKLSTRTMDKAHRKAARQLDEGEIAKRARQAQEFVGDFASTRYYFADLDKQTGKRTYEMTNSIIHSRNAGSVHARNAFGDVMEAHGLGRSPKINLSSKEAQTIAEYLYDLNPEVFENLSQDAKELAVALQDIYHIDPSRPTTTGAAAIRFRSITFKRFKDKFRQQMDVIEREQAKKKPNKKRVEAAQEDIEKALPRHGKWDSMTKEELTGVLSKMGLPEMKTKKAALRFLKMNQMAIVDAAWQDGTYYQELARQDFGTRRAYYMSDADFEAWSKKAIQMLKEPSLTAPVDIDVEVTLDDQALHTRNGQGSPLLHRNPVMATLQHLSRLSMIDEMYYPVQRFTDSMEGAYVTEDQRQTINLWLDNAAGNYQKLGKINRMANAVKHKWWQSYGWSVPRMGKFIGRNIGQNTLAAAQVDAKMVPKWAATAYSGARIGKAPTSQPLLGIGGGRELSFQGNPFIKEDMDTFARLDVTDKKILYDIMALGEHAGAKGANTRYQSLMDFGAQGISVSDTVNRLIFTYPVMHQAAFDTLSQWRSGRIPTKTMYSRLKLDTLPMAQRQQLEQMLENKQDREFIREYANIKTKNIHYGYATLERSALEQNLGTKVWTGPMTWGRSAFEQYYRSGVVPMIEGAQTNNTRKFFEGFKVFSKYLFIFTGLSYLYEKVTDDDKMYNVITSVIPTFGSPELTEVIQLQRNLQRAVYDLADAHTKEQYVKALTPIIQNSIDLMGTMTLPVVQGFLDTGVAIAESYNDIEGVNNFELMSLAYKDVIDLIVEGKVDESMRTGKQKLMRVIGNVKETVESQDREERRKMGIE